MHKLTPPVQHLPPWQASSLRSAAKHALCSTLVLNLHGADKLICSVQQETCLCGCSQDIDTHLLLQGEEALMKVQITHCDDSQTMLGITMAHVLAGDLISLEPSLSPMHLMGLLQILHACAAPRSTVNVSFSTSGVF